MVACMEVLSEVLKAVKLNGALFYNAEFSAPWCAHSVDAQCVNSHLSPNAQHVIIFHLLTQGSGYANLEGDDRQLPLNAGDILIVPSRVDRRTGAGRDVVTTLAALTEPVSPAVSYRAVVADSLATGEPVPADSPSGSEFAALADAVLTRLGDKL